MKERAPERPPSPHVSREDAWDLRTADDAAAGRLERFADEALAELEAGRTREI
jgi:hypothetical protein